MSKDQREVVRKLRILQHAEVTGQVAKTCLPWISAVGAYSVLELLSRYGTTDILSIARKKQGSAA